VIVAVPRETAPGERRVALVPDAAKSVAKLGHEVVVESGAGRAAGYTDQAYAAAGARVEADRARLVETAGVLLWVQPPAGDPLAGLREGQVVIGFLRPLDEPALVRSLAGRKLTAFAVELVPRITRAQSMDALSSQATIAGYRAVLLAAVTVPKLFPMLTTAAGTLSPARVLVIGAGVAGLQAIATARRLGAVVEAYDTRPVVKEQIESLGGRFVKLDLEVGSAQDAGGYAVAQSEAFYQKQRELLGRHVKQSDVVITTALVPGQPAPFLIDPEAVQGMRPGSCIVDLAAPNGGNCPLTKRGESIVVDGVTLHGPTNLPSEHPTHASQLYAKNLATFLQHLTREGQIALDLEDEITRGALLAHAGEIQNAAVKAKLA
jgi:NAD(P) transhydrogenase subunit alpha